MTRWLLVVLLALGTLLAGPLLAGPAAGVDVDALAEQLRSDPLLVDPDTTVAPDEEAVRAALADLPVPTYVLVLPQADVDAGDSGIDGVLLRLVEALDDSRAVVVVVTDGGDVQAGEGGASGVAASALLDRIVQEGAERAIDGSGRRAVGVAGLIAVAVLAGGLLWVCSQRRVRRQAPLSDATQEGSGW